jgi:Uma2 family endonuclease
MTAVKQRKLTVVDYLETPEGPPWFQLIEGALVQDPSPSSTHQTIVLNLALLLGTYLRSSPLGKIFVAPLDVYLSPENVFQPDLIYVSAGRRAIVEHRGLRAAPDLAVEILSPSSAVRDSTQKRRVYGASGTAEYWLINPKTMSLQIYEFDLDRTQPTRIVSNQESFTSRLFPGLTVPAAAIFEDI